MQFSTFWGSLAVGALLGAIPAQVGAQTEDPPLSEYRTTVLMRDLENPTQMAFLPDGRIYVTRKNGVILLYDPVSEETTTAATLDAGNAREDGLHGIVLDPDYPSSPWVFLLFSNETRDSIVVARFPSDPGSGTILTASGQTLLSVPYTINAGSAEHNTGHLAFGPDGNLFVALADNTQNIFSGTGAGYAPRDPARPLYDARRTAANTNDLRGKILRIRPDGDGGYTIPDGNLFPPGTANTRPEIYAMGVRHPFRITVDTATGRLYWAEPGPNAQNDNANQGPRGYEEVNLAKTPGNYGWPFCTADNACYTEFDYQTGTGGAVYDPDALVNTSPHNTGMAELPPARPAQVWYPYNAAGTEFPVFGSGGSNTAMIGPVYRFDPHLDSPAKLPAVFDRHLFIVEWSRSRVFVARLDTAGSVTDVRPFRDARDSTSNSPIDVKTGPDGALYFLNWTGTGYPNNSGNGTLTRLEYTGEHAPVALRSGDAGVGAGSRNGFLLLAAESGSFRLPAGASGADFYSLRGERLWSLRRADTSRPGEFTLPARVRGAVRVRLISP